MNTFERSKLPQSGAVKVNGAQGNAPEADALPLSQNDPGQPATNHNIMVALTDSTIDQEAIAVACKAARKHNGEVFGVYGIVVPFRLALDDEMAQDTVKANHALDQAKAVADQIKIHLETEIIHTRHFGQALIQEALDHECALIVLGVPYQAGVNGQSMLNDTAEYVLRNAPSRIWLVRGACPQAGARAAQLPASELSRV